MPLKLNSDELPTINLTSMIDVLFLLIIFFMVGTRFSENESSVKLTLPKSTRSATSANNASSKIVYVYADGTIKLDGQSLDLNQLTSFLSQSLRVNPNLVVQVKPDKDCKVGQAALVFEAIDASGAQALAFTYASTQMPSAQRR